ncbi:Uncharacterised protein [Achromobacter xylosoxidans]|nr:Uncharacterised protein [Achromobacter xylosoxidans]CUI62092.1 Uncharacterised protein [Achromobacter xylosoxidans]CUJ03554.1 Uncharacterised protein [Achromobacter xylosoxidans]
MKPPPLVAPDQPLLKSHQPNNDLIENTIGKK